MQDWALTDPSMGNLADPYLLMSPGSFTGWLSLLPWTHSGGSGHWPVLQLPGFEPVTWRGSQAYKQGSPQQPQGLFRSKAQRWRIRLSPHPPPHLPTHLCKQPTRAAPSMDTACASKAHFPSCMETVRWTSASSSHYCFHKGS